MGRPLSPQQIHQKNNRTLSKFHKTTSECWQKTSGTQKGNPLSLKRGFLANQDFLGFWTVDTHRERHSQRSAPQKRHTAHLGRRARSTPRKRSSWDGGGDKTQLPTGGSCARQAPGHLRCSDLGRAQNADPSLRLCGVPENLNLSGLDLGKACNPGPASESSQQSNLEPEQCRPGKHTHRERGTNSVWPRHDMKERWFDGLEVAERTGKLLRIVYLLSQSRKMLHRIYLAIKSIVISAKFYRFIFIASLAANLMLFYPLFPVRRRELDSYVLYVPCSKGWIGFGRKCFYFSDETRNWTFSQTFCTSEEAVLAQFETEEELNFLLRYKGPSDLWIGLSRESLHHVWKWTDDSKYNASFTITGDATCGYLNDLGVSSARSYTDRKWICSKKITIPCP
ncbi:C-type lectin domain family 2 member D6-like [Muntiacus reevesi]|uniref:C-type lectin domain family 2 member D6-like n=1 Tax=Muntiacus reevesi TaxID=9886 RepID=UPI00330718F3